MRNNTGSEGGANVAGQVKSSCKQYRLARRAVHELLTTPKGDQKHLLSSPIVKSSPPTETEFKAYTTSL